MSTQGKIWTSRGIVVLLLAGISSTACVSFPAKRSPQLSKPRVKPTLDEPVAIRLVVHDGSSKPKRVARALDRCRKKFSYLSAATEEVVDPDYTLELSVRHSETESKLNYAAGYGFFLIPARFSEEVTVAASVTGPGNRDLGVVRSTGGIKIVVQMHLLYVSPLTAPLVPHMYSKMWNNTFRDVFIQAGEAIAADQRRTGQIDTVAAGGYREEGTWPESTPARSE